jgi:hypothetical protein
MKHLWFNLTMNLSDESPEGPGWYVYATRAEGVPDVPVGLIPAKRISLQQVQALATVLDACMKDKDIPVLPSQIVESGNVLIGEAIDEQIVKAEEAAERVAKLKALRNTESTEKEKVTEHDVRRTDQRDGAGGNSP